MSLNIENSLELLGYLRQRGYIGADETPAMQTLAGGVSNRTVLVTRTTGEAWVLKQALAKLRVQADWFSDPTRVHREAMGLRRLSTLTPPGTIPTLLFEDNEAHLIGMSAVAQPHTNWKELLLKGRVEQTHIEQFAQILGQIHKNAWQQREHFAAEFADRSFFESLRLEPYYAYAAQQLPTAAPFLHELIHATRQRMLTLVHGDYSPKNILIHNERLVLLDHEVIHWGDPAFDVGFSMTHLLSKAHHLVNRRRNFVHAAHLYWQRYQEAAGVETAHASGTNGADTAMWHSEIEAYSIRHTLACLLARAFGRSPLEYLTQSQREKQATAALSTIAARPTTLREMIGQFVDNL